MASVFVHFWESFKKNFRHRPDQDAKIYLGVVVLAICLSFVCIFAPLLSPPCERPQPGAFPYLNPMFDDSPCHRVRYFSLLGLSRFDADIGRRMLAAIALAALIGYERRSPDRPAGIRTMCVTSLGACCFTISSLFAFESGSMHWDASRVTAAIPTGVGFVGSAIIWKGLGGAEEHQIHEIRGISTAASVWISAAVGVAAGGALYYTAMYTTLCVVLLLRFGPRNHAAEDDQRSEHISASPSADRVEDEKKAAEPTHSPPPGERDSLLHGGRKSVKASARGDKRPSLMSAT